MTKATEIMARIVTADLTKNEAAVKANALELVTYVLGLLERTVDALEELAGK